MKHTTISIILLNILLIGLAGCGKKQDEQSKINQQENITQGKIEYNSAAGINWTISKHWQTQPAKPMRVANYSIPATDGDGEAGECAVFYFGNDQGGNIDANINRWIAQFENPDKPNRETKEVNGFKITIVQIAGTYLAPAGPMMESQGKKENYRLLGAIVEAPEGLVFFKCTGPAKTMTAAETEFNELVNSIEKKK
jgi:hypothetical protein